MTSYLVTYDLGGPGRNYEALFEYLRSTGTYSRIAQSAWIVVATGTTSEAIRDGALSHLDSNDKLIVLKLTGEAAWYGMPKETSDWLKDCLGR